MDTFPAPLCRALRALLFVAVLGAVAPRAAAAGLTCPTQAVELRDAFAGWQLLVAEGPHDVTRAARYATSDPAIARVDAAGYVTPSGDGTARITITHGQDQIEVSVRVAGIAAGRP